MNAEHSFSGAGHDANVLSIGDDYSLLQSRQMVLRSAGYNVFSFASNTHPKELATVPADIVLICHTVDLARAETIVATFRQFHPTLPVLFLSKFNDGPRNTVLQQTMPASDPAGLLQRIDGMLAPLHLHKSVAHHAHHSHNAAA